MKECTNIILKYVLDSKEVPEDVLYEFSEEVIRIIEQRDRDSISDEFWELENYVELYWRGEKFSREESPKRIYQMGQLLSYTNMIAMWFEKAEQDISLEEYAESLDGKYLFFQSIHEKYGITHKELANRMLTSISALSQFVNRIKGNGFFMTRTMGREKHYYLTNKGEKLLEIMAAKRKHSERKYTKLLGELDNFNKAITDDTNYKMVSEKSNGHLTEQLYMRNKINIIGFAPVLKIDVNMRMLEDNSEVEGWLENGLNKIS